MDRWTLFITSSNDFREFTAAESLNESLHFLSYPAIHCGLIRPQQGLGGLHGVRRLDGKMIRGCESIIQCW